MTSLQIPDTQEAKFDLAFSLLSEALPRVYIISHRRARTLPTLRTFPCLWDCASIVVAEEEVPDYLDYLPWPIPKNYRGHGLGIGRARQFCLDIAAERGEEVIVILDDDLTNLSILYDIGGGKVSHAFTKIVGDRRDDFQHGLLVLTTLIAEEAFRTVPTAVIATPQCNNANRTTGSSRTRWELNRGGNPSQFQVWNVSRFFKYGGPFDLDRFNKHGEDISVACQIIEAGGAIVNVPSVIGQYLDYETQSVMRTPATAPALRQEEHDALMTLPLAAYVKTRYDVLDRPQWHSLDWRALERDGKVRSETTMWIDPDQ